MGLHKTGSAGRSLEEAEEASPVHLESEDGTTDQIAASDALSRRKTLQRAEAVDESYPH